MPVMMRRRRQIKVIPRPGVSISTSLAPTSGQVGFTITGNGFGVTAGTIRYAGILISVSSWGNSSISVTWPDLPFLATGSQIALNTAYPLLITTADFSQGSAQVSTAKRAGDIFRAITALTGIFANDPDLVTGELYYWRTTNGIIADITADGYIRGATSGAAGKYSVWDGAWSNTATVTIS